MQDRLVFQDVPTYVHLKRSNLVDAVLSLKFVGCDNFIAKSFTETILSVLHYNLHEE